MGEFSFPSVGVSRGDFRSDKRGNGGRTRERGSVPAKTRAVSFSRGSWLGGPGDITEPTPLLKKDGF
jgi:hypothetical protein